MERKFKVGDRVRVTNVFPKEAIDPLTHEELAVRGQHGTVTSVSEPGGMGYAVLLDMDVDHGLGMAMAMYEDEMELIA